MNLKNRFFSLAPALIPALAVSGLTLAGSAPARAQEVYVGVATRWHDLLDRPAQWQFVRENADGFYVNFIEMNWMQNNKAKVNPEILARTAALFTSKNAVLESDTKDASIEDDRRYLTQLQAAGFRVPITSLNYGWNASRAANLKTFALLAGQAPRWNLVQRGPWTIGGDVMGEKNSAWRSDIDGADGVSTDGPMGLWLSDAGQIRSGSISMVKYAHARGQKALVMLCPYGAQNPLYTPTQALTLSQQCVREHEDAGAIPDIWAVFEYATDISAVPEQIDGAPTSSTTGIAFWLLHHLKDPQHAARLAVAPQNGLQISTRPALEAETIADDATKQTVGVAELAVPLDAIKTSRTVTYELTNSNPWLDLCPVVKAQASDSGKDWEITYKLNNRDVTKEITRDGAVCSGDLRLFHRSNPRLKPHLLQITFAPKPDALKPEVATPQAMQIALTLMPHPSHRELVQQRLELRITPSIIPSTNPKP